MSSLRNAVQRRNHRERHQPTEREKWGLLEKRKDYKLRAADHKTKQHKIAALKSKAAERNEDEFYFGMVNATTDGGIRRAKRGEDNSGGGGKSLALDVVKLMKTQDRGYLQTMLQRTKRERERMEKEVVLGETVVRSESGNVRVMFGEDGQEIRPAELEGVDEDDLDMNPDVVADESDEERGGKTENGEDMTPEMRKAQRRKRHALDVKRRKLDALVEQETKLSTALDRVDQQRAKMNGTIGGVNKSGNRFKVRQRKR